MKLFKQNLIRLGGVKPFIAAALMTCSLGAAQSVMAGPATQAVEVANLHGPVVEVIEAAGYTYVAIDVDGEKVWAAGPAAPLQKGQVIGFSTKMPMANFRSKSLNRDFGTLYFVDGFITEDGKKTAKMSAAHGSNAVNAPKGTPVGKVAKAIEKVDGGKTIAEIYEQKANLNGKTTKVRGEVTKFTADILGKNWVHIRDSSTKTDLTVTMQATTHVGAVIVLEGKLAVEKDYGYGYVYPVIMEEAKILP